MLSLSVGVSLGGSVLSVGVEVYPWVEVYYLCRGDIVGWRCIVGGGRGVLSVGIHWVGVRCLYRWGYPWVEVYCRWGVFLGGGLTTAYLIKLRLLSIC